MKVPFGAWIALGVVAVHAAAFWFLADRHFLPKVKREPAPTPANFAARHTGGVDARTGEAETVSEYVVSTQLRPVPTPTAPPSFH